MRPRPDARALLVPTLAVGLVLTLSGCVAAANATGDRAVSVANCGATVTFAKPPQRVVLLKSAAVPFLAELGVLDTVVARAGAYPREYYDDQTWAALERIPVLTDQVDTSGHLQISREEVLAQRPDLVLGEVDNLNRATLAASGIPLIEEPALCAPGLERPDFDDVADQMTLYGEIFGREPLAEQANAALAERVAAARARVPSTEARTAAVLYPTIGGGITYAYGTRSMAAPQLEAAGLTNVFGDVDQRVFEVTREELIGRNPDVLILLYTAGEPAEVESALTAMTGVERISAVRNGLVITQLLNFSEPPTPLAVTGLERLVDELNP